MVIVVRSRWPTRRRDAGRPAGDTEGRQRCSNKGQSRSVACDRPPEVETPAAAAFVQGLARVSCSSTPWRASSAFACTVTRWSPGFSRLFIVRCSSEDQAITDRLKSRLQRPPPSFRVLPECHAHPRPGELQAPPLAQSPVGVPALAGFSLCASRPRTKRSETA
jgi:hypothetical protein